ncbi:cGMP-specific phosphodiesterase, putative [Plasmodium gallinaceum]|uniref:Phosphodiesterase n=1 Tax=Plasmodium gallinaceum TaxID=5849 RepID=A0A1J1GUD7_PLAGA|nr:cGMP-specific phosphodiesterase, putative [Plasmodium gallinaceum]CRG95913.1 cGMP-specific phosphodiesterase, putative [Plasmodium gallinaceum]
MDKKLDKKNPFIDENVFKKKYKFDKELSKSFEKKERKYDEFYKFSLLREKSFMSKKSTFEKSKDYLWKKMKNSAKKKSQKEYNNCLQNKNLKLICIIRKYIKFFFYLKRKSYKRNYDNYSVNNINNVSNINDYKKKEKKKFSENSYNTKYTEQSSLYQKLYYIFSKKTNFFVNIFKNAKIKRGELIEIEKCLIFKNKNSEGIFLNKFYSSFPFKIGVYSLFMILISLINFLILYYMIIKFIYEYTAYFLCLFKLLSDVLYFLFFVFYILFFNYKCIDNIIYYSYISCYFYVSFTLLHAILLLQSLSNIELNKFFINKYFSQKYIISMTNIYICLFCFLRNYMILYNFLLNLKFSFFCIICIFFFHLSCRHLEHQNKNIFIIYLFILCKILLSLYYEYNYERKWRILFLNRCIYEKSSNNNLTKYFSIDNSTPTSPIEDILHNLKKLLDIIKKIEEESNEKALEQIKKMKEKIKKCENILRTKNLNEVQIFKYGKFEKVYNMWCLDKIDNHFNVKLESNSLLSHNLNNHKKSSISLSNIQSLLSTKFQEHYNDAYEWNANIENIYKGNIFISIGYKLLYPLGVLKPNFNKEKLKNFLLKIYSLYNEVPYHNSLHAAQVAHFSKSMLFLLDINHKISAIDEFCLHVSSLCHDVGHPGLNNYFLINSEDNLALTYNDNSVLENYHCSLVFKTLKEENCNIFENYPYNIFITCRKNIIRAILSTDMKNHFEYISNFRTSKEFIDCDNLTTEQIWQIFCLVIKASDIGHASLEWNKHVKWTMKINEEFYLQGLLEKSLNMQKSFLCDITTIDKLATSQIDFLKHLCIPLFNELNYLCKNNSIYNHCIYAIENNIEKWEKKKNDEQDIGLQEKYKNDNLNNRTKLLSFM